MNIKFADIFRKALQSFIGDDSIQSRVGMTVIGENGGIGYQPGICGNLNWRGAVVRSAWWTDMTSGEVGGLSSFHHQQ